MTPINVLPEDVPTKPDGDGNPPVAKPLILDQLLSAWFEEWLAQPPRPHAVEDRAFRASWAGKCAREISYLLDDEEMSNPPDMAAAWAMFLGTFVHDKVLGPLVKRVFGETAEVELVIDFAPAFDGSAHADMLITLEVDGKRVKVLVELKTTNGFQYKKQVMGWKGQPPSGPRVSAFLQGALAAHHYEADFLVIGVVSLENISPSMARSNGWDRSDLRRIAAEWWFTPEEFTPVAEREVRRINRIIEAKAAGHDIARAIPINDMPAGARVINPRTGLWHKLNDAGETVMSGRTWYCDYCDFRDRCADDIDQAKETSS